MNFKEEINTAEQRFKEILEDFISGVFKKSNLISHGTDHHKRVWFYAKEVIELLGTNNLISDKSFPEKLIVSCYLHDSGMSVNKGQKHGKHSRYLCEEFLKMHELSLIEYSDVLTAIEKHDEKKYKLSDHPFNLLTILSVADDLDAFGNIGIYRYLEIYLARGVSMKESGYIIKENARKRFDNFIRLFGFNVKFSEYHKKRYEILVSFFDKFNRDISDNGFSENHLCNYCEVAKAIQEILQKNLKKTEIYVYIKNNYDNSVVRNFFESLLPEINEFNF